MLVSQEGGKPEIPEKNPQSKDENYTVHVTTNSNHIWHLVGIEPGPHHGGR